MGIRVVTPPEGEVITVADARKHCYVPGAAQDAKIGTLIKSATSHVQRWCDIALLTQVWELTLDAFPPVIKLTGGNVQNVVSVKYDDSAGVEQTLSDVAYVLDATKEPAQLTLAAGASWPAARAQAASVRVRYTVGYGDADAVPEDIKDGMRLLIADLFENRQAQQQEALQKNDAIMSLLMPFRRMVL